MLVTFVGSLVPEVIAYNAGLDACAGRWLEAMDLLGELQQGYPRPEGREGPMLKLKITIVIMGI